MCVSFLFYFMFHVKPTISLHGCFNGSTPIPLIVNTRNHNLNRDLHGFGIIESGCSLLDLSGGWDDARWCYPGGGEKHRLNGGIWFCTRSLNMQHHAKQDELRVWQLGTRFLRYCNISFGFPVEDFCIFPLVPGVRCRGVCWQQWLLAMVLG